MGGRALGRTVRAYVGLGANVGDPESTLTEAVHAVAALPGVRLRGVSRLYATTPVGVLDQADFRNAVVAIDVAAGDDPETAAADLLIALKDLERRSGRRSGRRWGPRELDLDILVFGRHRIAVDRPDAGRSISAAGSPSDEPRRLEVPHRDARERLFVLAPLADLAPWLVPPGWPETVTTARDRRRDLEGADAARPVGRWDATEAAWVADGAPG